VTINDAIREVNRRSYFQSLLPQQLLSTDISGKEHLALILRYLDASVTCENFIGFLELPPCYRCISHALKSS